MIQTVFVNAQSPSVMSRTFDVSESLLCQAVARVVGVARYGTAFRGLGELGTAESPKAQGSVVGNAGSRCPGMKFWHLGLLGVPVAEH